MGIVVRDGCASVSVRVRLSVDAGVRAIASASVGVAVAWRGVAPVLALGARALGLVASE